MCLLTISSTNDKLSWIIGKNPTSGMTIRKIKKGTSYGFYSETTSNTYIIYFRDAPFEISYGDGTDNKIDYMNTTRYTSTLFVLNAISEYFNQTMNKLQEFDSDNFESVIVINLMYMNNQSRNICKKLSTYIQNIDITIEHIIDKNYRIAIKGKTTIMRILNTTFLIAAISSILNDIDFDFNDSFIDKLVRCINIIDAPYYIRYLASAKLIPGKKIFERYQAALETHPKQKICLHFGNTAVQRRDFIEKRIGFSNNIIDIGCGEGFYAIPFAKKLSKTIYKYYAIDTDSNHLTILQNKAKKHELDNIIVLNNHNKLSELDIMGKNHVIITEVIEHVSIESAIEIIKFVLDTIDYETIIITTPNYEFNCNYNLEHEFRHKDHQRELTRTEFRQFMTDIIAHYPKISYQFVDIGDTVNDVSVTQGIVIVK